MNDPAASCEASKKPQDPFVVALSKVEGSNHTNTIFFRSHLLRQAQGRLRQALSAELAEASGRTEYEASFKLDLKKLIQR